MVSPWFFLCCSAVAFYHQFGPRYNKAFAILAGIFLGTGIMCLVVGKPWPEALIGVQCDVTKQLNPSLRGLSNLPR